MCEPVPDLLDEVAAIVMTADVTDLGSIDALGQGLRSIREALQEEASPPVATVLIQVVEALDRLQSGNSPQPEAELDVVRRSIAALQDLLQNPPSEDKEDVSTPGEPFQLPDLIDGSMFTEFISDQRLRLQELERVVLEFEQGDADLLSEIKREIHTLKGEAGVLGMEDMQTVCHALEDTIEQKDIGPEFGDHLLTIRDWLSGALDSYAAFELPKPRADEVIADLGAEPTPVAPCDSPLREPEGTEIDKDPEDGQETRVRFVERDDDTVALVGDFLSEAHEGLAKVDETLIEVEQSEAGADAVNRLFRVFHTIKGVASFLELGDVTSIAHSTETMMNAVREGQLEFQGEVLDLVFDATSMVRQMLDLIRNAVERGEAIQSPDGFEELLAKIDQARAAASNPDDEVTNSPNLTSTGPPSPPKKERLLSPTAAAPEETEGAGPSRPSPSGPAGVSKKLRETVKVDLDRVDKLVEQIGELVIVEAMVAHAPEVLGLKSERVQAYLSQLTKITNGLQDVGMAMRMVPVRGIFQKMARLVRDLSRKSSKQVEFVLVGEGTEMDRSMVERIADPLVHMIRNAIDHGIETPDQRRESGKSPVGRVRLSAYHEGGAIVIELEDDGRGLDRAAILTKAQERGLVREDDTLTDGEVYELIFAPGFSTAAKVTEISGRGVGMDVVRRSIESVRGRVGISARPGQGTTFRMILPLTLAIIDGMQVACGREHYILPTLSIVESIKPEAHMVCSMAGRGEVLSLRGETYPLFRLDQLLDIDGAVREPAEGLIVLVESRGRRVGLLVDDVVTQQQVVIKSLGSGLTNASYLSGAAIMSDGRVGLIINLDELAVLMDERRQAAAAEPSNETSSPPPQPEDADLELCGATADRPASSTTPSMGGL